MALNPAATRAVLWDLDGTLVDTAPLHWEVWNEVLAGYGRSLTLEEFLPTFGLRNDTVIPLWIGAHLSAEEVQYISEVKEKRFRERLAETPVALLPGALDWLARLKRDGWWQALATMTPRKNLESILRTADFAGYLDALVTAEDVARGKPAPDVFLAAASKLDVPPMRCIVVEDAPAGVDAGRSAGMRVIAVGPSVAGVDADLHAASLLSLPADSFERLVNG